MTGRYLFFICLIISFSSLALISDTAFGATEEELRQLLQNQNSEITQLEKEIALYQKALSTTKTEKSGLQAELSRLELTRKKLGSDVNLTKKKIAATETTIASLSDGIKQSEQGISLNQQALAESLRTINHYDQNTITTILLEDKNFSNFLGHIANLSTLHGTLKSQLFNLQSTKKDYEVKKTTSEKEYEELALLEDKLVDQKTIVEQNAGKKNVLLAETQNKEQAFQQLLADRLRKKEAVEAELRKAEEALNLIVNPSSLPTTGRGVIKWPLDKVIVTQYFGNTPFATANSQIYKGKGHNGIDLGASIGTPIKAVLNGVVEGVGNTDIACKGASYGKWVMVRHPNGLSSVYAHLSLSNVTKGQIVSTGEVIAYSGDTGYVTGPHLHFTLLASEGSQVGSLQSKVPGCGVYTIPMATPEAVLNPLSYL
ncbi:MAG TPA: peptidoglycan DD-metalloendopeptidase family protein [Candidatus Paceibacterota bacterium]